MNLKKVDVAVFELTVVEIDKANGQRWVVVDSILYIGKLCVHSAVYLV